MTTSTFEVRVRRDVRVAIARTVLGASAWLAVLLLGERLHLTTPQQTAVLFLCTGIIGASLNRLHTRRKLFYIAGVIWHAHRM